MHSALAFVFPGQGSQFVGMLAQLLDTVPEVSKTLKVASDRLGFDVEKLMRLGPESTLNQTEITQPLMLAASVAVWRGWLSRYPDIRPAYMAGHSLGEYSALVCAGAIDFEGALTLVQQRARLMQAVVPEGAGSMVAVMGLTDPVVRDLCERARQVCVGQVVAPANYNAPGQVVVGGHASAVEYFSSLAKDRGARRILPIAMSAPSHCSLMQKAADQLAPELSKLKIQIPEIPIVANVSAEVIRDPDTIRQALLAQISNPVLWTDVITTLIANGINRFYEAGPGRVLTGLIRRIDPNIHAASLATTSDMVAAAQEMMNGSTPA